MNTHSTIQSVEQEVTNLESEFKRITRDALLPGLVSVIGLCTAGFTLRLIMEDGNIIPAGIGLAIGLFGLGFAVKARKKFDEINRQLVSKRDELAKLKQENNKES